MSNTVSRRKFVVTLGTLAAALPLGASAFDFIPSKGNSFRFVLLGDIHFDHEKFHDLEYVRTKFSEGDVTQVHDYSRITRENLPSLMRMARTKGRDQNADFYLQLGDFVEGLCGSEELAREQTEGFISLVKEQNLGRPFFVIKGNHDITGEGAPETYKKLVLPWQSREQKQSMPSANSTFVHKHVRFILFDGYTPDQSLEWLKDVLNENREKQVIFCVHQPVVPFNARANWHVFGRPKQQEKREEFIELLGEHNVTVLCGHLHKTSVLTRRTQKGKFVQICTGSVINSPDAPIKDYLSGVDAYGAELVNLEPAFAPATLEERKQNLEREKPHIGYYEYADFMGYSVVSVDEQSQIGISIYKNVDNHPWKEYSVSDLFNA